jgi:hypothetical protein
MKFGTALVLGLCLIGCGGGDDPDVVVGDFAMTSLRGVALPYDDVNGCCIYESGSLELDEDQYLVSGTFRNRNSSVTTTGWESGTFQLDGDFLRFQPLSANIAAFHLGHATIHGDTIRLSLGGEGPGEPDSFAAVFVRQ